MPKETKLLKNERPKLLKEWNYEKNYSMCSPYEVSVGSMKKVWWKCEKGHEWQATINNRSRGSKCPFCSGKKIVIGETDLATTNPELLKEWDYEKNIISPKEVSSGSHAIVWWKCSKGHEWKSEIRRRTKGGKCPYCGEKRILAGFNDLETKNSSILKERDYKKNKILPNEVGVGSNKRVWWICEECGHEWQTPISSRVAGTGCPVCGLVKGAQKNKIAKYDKSLAALYPELAKEWDYEKNGDVSPDTINTGSNYKYWWKCKKCGQSYCSPVRNRVNGYGCTICAGKIIVSGINDFESWCKNNDRLELLKEWDYKRNDVSPKEIAPFTNKKIWFLCKKGHSYNSRLANKIKNDSGCPICDKHNKSSFQEQAIFYYLKTVYPDAINSYHIDWLGNLELDIYIPSIQTAIEYDGVAWHKNKKKLELKKDLLCKKNGTRLIRIREEGLEIPEQSEFIYVNPRKKDSLNTAINNLIKDLSNHDIDINIERDTYKIVEQFDKNERLNSVLKLYPDIASEWDYDKNGTINPEYISYGSTRKYWRKCKECKNEYLMSPNNRTHQKQGCPICSKKKRGVTNIKRIVDLNGSLSSNRPDILSEWDYDKNQISPEEISVGSKKKAWRKCKTCNGSWEATICNRTKTNNTTCPYCSGRKVLKGYNDFKTKHPDLVNEWHPKKNDGLAPDMFTCGSSKKIVWICSNCNNEWKASINDRSLGRGCPVCSRDKVAKNHQKRIRCIEKDIVFNSVKDGAKWAGISSGTLVTHLKGKYRTAGGYHWEYYHEK